MTKYLKSYLDFYQKTSKPGYGVLVTGDWGAGKSYQVKNFLKKSEFYYISLFGIQNSEEAHAAVIAEVDPKLSFAKKMFNGLEEKTASSGHWVGALGSAAAGFIGAALRKEIEIDRTLVFDDLERSNIDTKDLFGFINYYIEHQEARVIVIAHDKKLANSFQGMNEKLFGQTIKIEPMIEPAFDKFKNEIKNKEIVSFIESHKANILNIFLQSNVKSLRILRHVIEDISRLYNILSPRHTDNVAAMVELISLFCAFDFEIRNKSILFSDLLNRRGRTVRFIMRDKKNNGNTVAEKPEFVSANDRYLNLDLESYLINDASLTEMFVYGNYDSNTISASLDESHYFIQENDVPPWKIVINFDEIADNIVEDAVKSMERQFINREVIIPGEILQIFSLKMMMSFYKIVPNNMISIKKECLMYIDDLLEDGRLPASPPEWRLTDGFSESYDNRGYWVLEEYKDHFEEVRKHLVSSMDRALHRKFPIFANELLNYMKTDAMKFLESVGRTGAGSGKYEYAPVLKAVDPKVFVQNWIDSPYENWRIIQTGLEVRYASGRLEENLPEERDWFLQVIELMEAEDKKADGFAALRIRRAIYPKLTAIRDEIILKDG